jgi:hypothetical protein
MRALFLAAVLLAFAAPAAGAQDALDRAAAALRSDPVYVDPDAELAITDAQANELRARIGDRDIYVAILPGSRDEARAVAADLANRVGRPGTYGIVVAGRFVAGPSSDAVDASSEAFEAHRDEGVSAVLLDFVDRVEGGGGDGGGVGAGVFVVLGLAGAGGAALLVSRRRRRRRLAAEFAEVKDNARDDLVALGDDIRALEVDMDMPNASAEAREDYARAVECYDRADQAWRLARAPADLEPVGSALEEGRWAMSCARARTEGRPPPERRPPCFFDPRHGPSTRDVEWAPSFGAARMVPACEADAQRLERGEEPQAREVLVGGRRTPYWDAGPAYAPFAGGFFGTGLLPGLVIGTMLDDSFGAGGGDWGGGGDFGGGDFGGGDFGGGGDF